MKRELDTDTLSLDGVFQNLSFDTIGFEYLSIILEVFMIGSIAAYLILALGLSIAKWFVLVPAVSRWQIGRRSIYRSKMPSIQVYTTKHLFIRVTEWLSELKVRHPEMKVAVDAPAGGGALTQFLTEELQMKTIAVEIDKAKWNYPLVEPLIGDIGKKLEMRDESADLVVCLEGLKHFTDVSTAISEFTRVLKPEGFLVLTIPNDLGMQTRARYLFDGWVDVDWISPMNPNSQNERDHFHLNSLVSLPYLSYFFDKNKLRVVKTGADRYRFWSTMLAVLLFPILYFVNARKMSSGHFLKEEMVSLTWLAGRRNIILCQKS